MKPPGQAPYGYRWETRKVRDLQPHDREQAILGQIRAGRRAGKSLQTIATELNAQGHTTRRGSAWTRQMVHKADQGARRRQTLDAGSCAGNLEV